MEIDSKAPVFEAFEEMVAELVASEHPAKEEIEAKIEEIRNGRENLEKYVI